MTDKPTESPTKAVTRARWRRMTPYERGVAVWLAEELCAARNALPALLAVARAAQDVVDDYYESARTRGLVAKLDAALAKLEEGEK